MVRRKIALVSMLLFLMVLLLSPWASAPTPSSPASADDPDELQTLTLSPDVSEPADRPLAPVDLRVAAALKSSEFESLRRQSEKQAYQFRDIRVSFVRIDPAAAYSAYANASRVGEAADVMLMDNEWVKTFAVSGFLSPADSAFAGDALSEQFDALVSPLRWNGYMWGVPRDFDPYVLLWNLDALRTIAGDSEASPPDQLAQWQELAAASQALESPLNWLAIGGSDPLALLYWVQAVTGETPELFRGDGNSWRDTPVGEALALLDLARSGVVFGRDLPEVVGALTSGDAAAAIVPYSEARKLADGRLPDVLLADLSAWKQAYVWPRGRSFVISSRTKADDAARRWIAAITEPDVQRDQLQDTGKLPVYQSLYREMDDRELAALLSSGDAGAFPRSPLPDFGPDLPARLADLGGLWQDFAAGAMDAKSWVEQTAKLSTDAKLDD